MSLITKAFASLRRDGLATTLRRSWRFLTRGFRARRRRRRRASAERRKARPPTLDQWLDAYGGIGPDAIGHEDASFAVVLIGDAAAEAMTRTVDSLVAQTHEAWTLEIVEPADDAIDKALLETIQRDERVILNKDRVGRTRSINAVLRRTSADYFMLLDAGVVLQPETLTWFATASPAAGLIYADELHVPASGEPIPFFKPDWSPRLLTSFDYLRSTSAIKTVLARAVGGIRPGFTGAEHYDLALRVSEFVGDVAHLPNLLFERPAVDVTTEERNARLKAEEHAIAALQEAIARRGWSAKATPGTGIPGSYRVHWDPPPEGAVVKVVIPTRDRVDLLRNAVIGVLERTDDVAVHLVIVDNGSVEEATLEYLEDIGSRENCSVVRHDEAFNYSRLVNLGVATGPETDVVLLLNNDVTIPHRGWLRQMIGWFEDPEVLAVGTKLLFPDGRIQHGGVIIGFGGKAAHYALGQEDAPHPASLHDSTREVSCATAACLAIRSDAFAETGGFDEMLPIDFQDVDFCLRLVHDLAGTIVYDPTYPLVHEQGASRGTTGATNPYTITRLRHRWEEVLTAADPFYSPHLSRRLWVHTIGDVAQEGDRVQMLEPRWSRDEGTSPEEILSTLREHTPSPQVALAGLDSAITLKPVMVTGGGRSGTTLLMQLLGTSPAIAFDRIAPFEHRYLTYLVSLCRLAHPVGDVTELPEGWGMGTLARATEELIGRLPFTRADLIADDEKPYWTDLFHASWALLSERAIAQQPQARYYAEKTPHWVVENVRSLLADHKVLLSVRDPRDVLMSVASMVERRGRASFGLDPGRPLEDFAPEFAANWGRQLEWAFDARTEPDIVIVRYEDMIDDLAGSAARLSGLLGVSLDSDRVIADRAKFSRHMTSKSPESSVGRWHREMSDPVKKAFVEIDDLLETTGYERTAKA